MSASYGKDEVGRRIFKWRRAPGRCETESAQVVERLHVGHYARKKLSTTHFFVGPTETKVSVFNLLFQVVRKALSGQQSKQGPQSTSGEAVSGHCRLCGITRSSSDKNFAYQTITVESSPSGHRSRFSIRSQH